MLYKNQERRNLQIAKPVKNFLHDPAPDETGTLERRQRNL